MTVDEKKVQLQLWDVAGHERYGTMTRAYYANAYAAMIVFDLSRKSTLEAVAKWKEDVESKVTLSNGDKIPCVLLANKVNSHLPAHRAIKTFSLSFY